MRTIAIKRPIVVAVIGYIIGILWGLYFNFSIVLFYFPIIVLHIFFRKRFNKKKKFKLLSFKRYFRYVKLIISFKTLIYIIVFSIISNTIILFQNFNYENLYKEGKIKLTGIVVSVKKENQYSSTYKIKVKYANNSKKYKGTYLYLKVSKKQSAELEYGDEIQVDGKYEKPDKQRNYGGYDAEKNFKMNNIYGIVECNNIKIIGKGKINFISMSINKISLLIKENIHKYIEGEEASILQGILLGDTRNG